MRIQPYRGAPYRGSNQDIERIAGGLRKTVADELGDKFSTRALLFQIVNRTGGEVEVVEDPSQQEAEGGSLVIRKLGDYTIFLSPWTTPLRDNFTIAHELGHFFLHFHLQREKPATPIGFTRYGSSPIEWQANRFAAALLMPIDLFRQKHDEFSGDHSLLSGWFEVSPAAVQVRAESFGIS